jgi:ATP-dependent protease HslVU (ClpYQ) peptidase subunit
MTVIAWDGQTLAADRMGMHGDLINTQTKIWRSMAALLAMKEWYEAGATTTDFPEIQKTENWAHLVVVVKGKLFYYEQTHHRMKCEDRCKAFGVGREFAMGAMLAGATAVRAVELTGNWIGGCGRGVDSFECKEFNFDH